MSNPRMAFEELLCGVDEAGRGPLAGPVCAAAVILDPDKPIEGLADSKALSHRQRERLASLVQDRSRAWAIAWASVEEIDRLNIRQANFLAMQRAVGALGLRPTRILVDGRETPAFPCAVECVIGGDALVREISAASILAKTARDSRMCELEAAHPGYGFAVHKGYGVPVHMEALRRLGPCPEHRMSFRPVREAAEALGVSPSRL
jgi:ribonuclease HII